MSYQPKKHPQNALGKFYVTEDCLACENCQDTAQYLLSANPGDYEFKLAWRNHLARSIKFTVGADGKFDNGIAANNKLGSNRVIVPVQIIGDQDGQWDRAAEDRSVLW